MSVFKKRMNDLLKKEKHSDIETLELQAVSSFTEDEMLRFGNFERFFDEIDKQYGHDPKWRGRKSVRKYNEYKKVYSNLMALIRG